MLRAQGGKPIPCVQLFITQNAQRNSSDEDAPKNTFINAPARFERNTRSAVGDHGARDYLAEHDHLLVECADLATGVDVDSRA